MTRQKEASNQQCRVCVMDYQLVATNPFGVWSALMSQLGEGFYSKVLKKQKLQFVSHC